MSIFNGLKIKNGVLLKCSKRKKKVTIPKRVHKIHPQAFKECKNLKQVIIKAEITELPGGTFSHCTNLESVSLPDTLVKIDYCVFSSCTSVQEIDLPKGIVSIGESAFSHCTSLRRITIPDKVTQISKETFCSCTALEEVKMPETVEKIAKKAFSGCTSLKSIKIPEKVTKICEGVFSECKSLTATGLHESITDIGKYAYSGCTSLKSVTLGKNVRSIYTSSFAGCTLLDSLALSDDIFVINNTYKLHHGYSDIQERAGSDSAQKELIRRINGSVRLIISATEPSFFIKNKTLIKYKGSCSYRTVYIPLGVEHIAEGVFEENSHISHIIIPASVRTIDKSALWRCRGLEAISFLGCPVCSLNFSYESKLQRVFIPSDRKSSDYDIKIAPEDLPLPREVYKGFLGWYDPDSRLKIYDEGPVVYDPVKRIYKKKVQVEETVSKVVDMTWDERQQFENEVFAEVSKKWDGVRVKHSPMLECEYAWDLQTALDYVDRHPGTRTEYETVRKWIEVEVPAPRTPKIRSVRFDNVPFNTYGRYMNVKAKELKDGVYDSESCFIRNLD
ncbi:MAG: leucine-rich repeat protein [Clostridia bacterium]|nr:leucine-rich repeat protein [Clostridia bacterium]